MSETQIKSNYRNYLTSIGVGRILGVGPDRVRQMARAGQLTAAIVLSNGQRLFDPEEAERVAAERRKSAASEA